MRRIALRLEGEGEHVIAYRGRAFLFDGSGDERERELMDEAEEFLGLRGKLDGDTHYDLLNAVRENLPEALVGEVTDDGYLLMTPLGEYRHGRGSRLLQGLLRAMGLRGARTGGDLGAAEEEIPAAGVTGGLPDSLLHGTTSEHMPGILRFGLTADESRSNYELGRSPESAVRHGDTVFLTDRPGKAAYHAVNAVHQLGVRRSPWRRDDPYSTRAAEAGFPVIVEFAVPDKSKLVPDYDIDVWSDAGEGSFGQTGEQRRRMRERGYAPRTQEDPFKLSKRFGMFGYRGRIPASFIRSIRVFTGGDLDEYRPGDWPAVTREQLERAMDIGEAAAWDWEDPEEDEDWDWDAERDREPEGESVAASAYWRASARLGSARLGDSGYHMAPGMDGSAASLATYLAEDVTDADPPGHTLQFVHVPARLDPSWGHIGHIPPLRSVLHIPYECVPPGVLA